MMADSGQLSRVCSLGGERREHGLDDATGFDDLQDGVLMHELYGYADPLKEELGRKAGHVGPVAAAYIEYSGGHQSPHRLPCAAARDAELQAELRLRRQPMARAPLTGGD